MFLTKQTQINNKQSILWTLTSSILYPLSNYNFDLRRNDAAQSFYIGNSSGASGQSTFTIIDPAHTTRGFEIMRWNTGVAVQIFC